MSDLKGKVVVQAEFFLVKTRGISYDEMCDEFADRIEEGLSLKTAVRFFDDGGFISEKVRAFGVDKDLCYFFQQEYSKMGRWERFFRGRRYRAAFKRMFAVKHSLAPFIHGRLHAAAETTRKIALELPDRSFRLIQADELHEIVESTRLSTSVWLFLFDSDDLLVEGQEVSQSLTF